MKRLIAMAVASTKPLQVLLVVFFFLATAVHAADTTPLHDAAGEGNKAKVEALLAQGADVKAKDKRGDTPLNKAVEKGKKDIVALLLAKGADVNAKDGNGDSPLFRAVSRRDKDVAELLLAKGADASAKNRAGTTPLHMAAFWGMKDLAELLLAKGADVNATGLDGQSPLNVAKAQGHKDVVELLESHKLKQALGQANPRARFAQLAEQIRKKPDDDGTRQLIIRFAQELKPAPAVPGEAEKFEGRAQYAFRNAKSETELLDAAREYLKAVEAAPWVAGYYHDLCIILEKANRPAEAIRACKFYLIAAPAADAGDARKRIAGLEYLIERRDANIRSRVDCNRFSDGYETGKVAIFGNSRISVQLISVMQGGVPRNQLMIYDITNGNANFGQRKNLDPVDETFRLDDRVEGTPWYRFTISRDGRVTFGSAGAAQAEIVTSMAELLQLRVERLKGCLIAKPVKENKYYVLLFQGGPAKSSIDGALVSGVLLFSSDCSGALLGDKPGWLPEIFMPYEEFQRVNMRGYFVGSAINCAQSVGGGLGWLTP